MKKEASFKEKFLTRLENLIAGLMVLFWTFGALAAGYFMTRLYFLTKNSVFFLIAFCLYTLVLFLGYIYFKIFEREKIEEVSFFR